MGFVEPMRNRYQTGGLQHLLARQIRSEVGVPMFASYFKFSIVRNPWDKVISQWHFMQRRPDLRAYIGLDDGAPLAEYLERTSKIEHVQWIPQVSFVQDANGNELVDFIGRFETLEADAQHIFARIGVSCPLLPRRNASERISEYRCYFNVDTCSAVARIYAADIERFGYSF
jgi:hypothetical protein